MLVNVREFMEHPEGMRGKLIPSLIRLRLLNECLRQWIDASNFSEEVAGVTLLNPCDAFIPRISEDREFRFLSDMVREWDSRIILRESIGQMIEGSPQIVENISYQKDKWINWDCIDSGVRDEITRAVRVFLMC